MMVCFDFFFFFVGVMKESWVFACYLMWSILSSYIYIHTHTHVVRVVCILGVMLKPFKVDVGLHQEFVLSPWLFVILKDRLSRCCQGWRDVYFLQMMLCYWHHLKQTSWSGPLEHFTTKLEASGMKMGTFRFTVMVLSWKIVRGENLPLL